MDGLTWTNINPYIEAGSGEAYYFTYQGEEYFVECWATHNASGQDIYEATTGAHVIPFQTAEESDAFDEALDQVRAAWSRIYTRNVQPVMTASIEEFVALTMMPVDTESSGARQHYIETGMFPEKES